MTRWNEIIIWMERHLRLITLIAAALSTVVYPGAAWLLYHRLGFPLDDAWIHQTFARNIAQRGEFAFLPGQPSAGSTSPLWSLLLASVYLLPFDYRVTTYALGALFLAATALLVYRLSLCLFPDKRYLALLAALFALFEWHLNWAAFSGMETILFTFLSLLLLDIALHTRPGQPSTVGGLPSAIGGRLAAIGLIGSLLFLTRPEGVVLFFLIVFFVLRHHLVGRRWRALFEHGAVIGMTFTVPLIPYVAFNLSTTGLLLPNTFYAKQAEFSEMLLYAPLWRRLVWLQPGSVGSSGLEIRLGTATVTFVGAQVLLLPGFLLAIYLAAKERRLAVGLTLAWWFILPILYALRLPAIYQHGRYLMPTISLMLPIALWGTSRWMASVSGSLLGRVISKSLAISTGLLVILFWLRGAQAFALDVDIMDCQVVETAAWLEANTPRDAIIAVHDIGAAGYLLPRRLVDLAGLITPEVVPFIRDEERLLDFMRSKSVDYVVTVSRWYPAIVQDTRVRLVHRQFCPTVVAAGGEEMAVYRTVWEAPR